MLHLQNLAGQFSQNPKDLFHIQTWYPEGIEKLDETHGRLLWEQLVCLVKRGPFKWLWSPANTHTQAQTQRHRTTNRPVFYLAEHRLPLGLIGSVDWFCPRVVRTLRAETATQLYWDALRLWADAAQSQVKQTVAKLKTTWWPFPQILPSFVEVCMH